jgi:multiple sugar transport system substrate-binding protein
MGQQFDRRTLVGGALGAFAALGLAGCIPALGPRQRPAVNIGFVTYPNSFQPGTLALYKAALAVTRAHAQDYDLNVVAVTASLPTPGSLPKPASGIPRIVEPSTVSSLEQALDQEPPIDVVLFDSGLEFAFALQRNLLQPMDPLFRSERTASLEDFFGGAVKAVSDRGQVYGLPLAVQPTVLQYDQRLFDAAHVDPPNGSWTWTTFLNAAKALTSPEANGGAGQFGVDLTGQADVIPIFIWQNGGDLVSPDGTRALVAEPPALEALTFIYDLIHTHKVAAVPPSGPSDKATVARSITAVGPGESPPLYGPNGSRVAMRFLSYNQFMTFGIPAGGRSLRLAEVPRGKSQATLLAITGILALTQKARDPRAAFRVAALLAAEMQKEMIVPAARSVAKDLAKLHPTIASDDAAVLTASLEYARSLPLLSQSALLPLLYQQLLQPIQQGEKTPEEIARAAAAAFDAALNQSN